MSITENLLKDYETFEHGADIGIRGYGKTPEEALSNLLKALATLQVENPLFLLKAPELKDAISLSAEYMDELLVVFVNKVISLNSLNGAIYYQFTGKLEKRDGVYHLVGEIYGVPFDFEKYGFGVEVKGATFTLAKFEKMNEHYVAQCVVDV
jgi:SHS2 domain-containing protein